MVLSTGLFAVFKYIGKKGLDQFPVIIINYITCFILGNLVLGEQHIIRIQTLTTSGFVPLVSLGLLFVGTFFLMAKSTNESGAAASSMASKMSMIIPIIASVLFWGEAVNIQMFLGIVLAISSVYMISRVSSDPSNSKPSSEMREKISEQSFHVKSRVQLKSKQNYHPPKRFNIILILVFLGSGMVDTLLNVFKQLNYNEFNNEQKAVLTFGGAMISGLLVWAWKARARMDVNAKHEASNVQGSNCESSSLVGEPMHLNTPTN